MIAAREYSSGAENVAAANAIRKRIWGKPRIVNIVTRREPEPIPLRYWQTHKTRFDSHLSAYRRWNEALEQPCKVFIKRRCKELGVSYLKIVGGSRKTIHAWPRQVLMWEVKTFLRPDITWHELGRLFNRDHKTAFYSVHKVADKKTRGEI